MGVVGSSGSGGGDARSGRGKPAPSPRNLLQLLPEAASTPTRSHPVYFGERKEIRDSPRKNVCLETFWAVGTLQTKYQYRQVKDNGCACPNTAAHHPLLKACPEMLSHFAGGGGGAEEGGGWPPWSQNSHLGPLKPKLSPKTPSTPLAGSLGQ